MKNTNHAPSHLTVEQLKGLKQELLKGAYKQGYAEDYLGFMLVDKKSSSVILEFLLKEAQHAGGRSNDKRLQ